MVYAAVRSKMVALFGHCFAPCLSRFAIILSRMEELVILLKLMSIGLDFRLYDSND